MKRYALLLLMFFPMASFALNLFQPAQLDQSLMYLSSLFGDVGTVLQQGGSDLLKNAFSYFNNAVLVLGGIIIVYSLVVSTINTSHDGEMLGKKWNSVWIPMRAASGFALLLPVTTMGQAKGYALIQVFVMWVIVQGVGAADYIWSASVSGLTQSGSAMMTGASYNDYQAAGQIFVSEVCSIQAAAQYSDGNDVPTTTVMTDPKDGSQKVGFGIEGLQPHDVCGWAQLPSDGGSTDPDYLTMITRQTTAEYALMNQLHPTAQEFVDQFHSSADLPNAVMNEASQTYYQTAIQQAARNYASEAANAKSAYKASSKDGLGNTIETAKQWGWVMAGPLYMHIADFTDNINVGAGSGAITTNGNIGSQQQALAQLLNCSYGSVSDTGCYPLDAMNRDAQTTATASVMSGSIGDSSGYKWAGVGATVAGGAMIGLSIPASVTGSTAGAPLFFMGLLLVVVGIVNLAFYHLLTAWPITMVSGLPTTYTGLGVELNNPIITMREFGLILVYSTIGLWLTGMATLAAASMVGFWDSCMFPTQGSYASISAFIMPLISVAFTSVMGIGAVMAYYIPMVPFLLFSGGVMNWLVFVVEAMAAAPLMALGILHPEGGHDIWGSAQTGMMILAGVFLRPALMIIGYLAATLAIYVVFGIINGGFFVAARAFLKGAQAADVIGQIMILVMYVNLTLIAVNQAFSLIHKVPDRVLHWVGGEREQTEDFTKDLRQAVEGGAKGLQDGMKSGERSMGKAAKMLAKNRAKSHGAAPGAIGGEPGGGAGGGVPGGGVPGGADD